MRQTYSQNKRYLHFTYTCEVCGKKRRKQFSDYYTMSPFNRLSREENEAKIKSMLEAQKNRFLQAPRCSKCS